MARNHRLTNESSIIYGGKDLVSARQACNDKPQRSNRERRTIKQGSHQAQRGDLQQGDKQPIVEGVEFIYGINPVGEALSAGRPLFTVYALDPLHRNVAALLKEAEKQHINIRYESRDFFEKRFGKGHQGIAAHVACKKILTIADLPELIAQAGAQAFFLVVDCIEDPRNFGAMLRTAEVSGVHGVIFQQSRSAGISPSVSKASAGALEHLTLVQTVNIKHALRLMKDAGIKIIGTEAHAEISAWDAALSGPLAIVMGSESEGLRRTVRDLCEMVVSLPMCGHVRSLNVSVATGIILYEVLRQRTMKYSTVEYSKRS
jgi:23S rRNA (guanosine2251-2'-O)-methyltransferase